ncbi:MAG TPA: alpha/beta fold hydrolase [Gammaproteobacteria bacterium]|nr:alpha/beta fold hydrolase [Gammaproteobacteria bacterium]
MPDPDTDGPPPPDRNRPFQVDENLYPFTSHWLECDGGVLHYLDEGEGFPVLLLHGNPTWSFLYRDVIKALRGHCRCIAPDYPGFGLSTAPPGYGYTPQGHTEWVAALIDHLELERYILVAHDWGGPIGLAAALQAPDRLAGMVLSNTWAWPVDLRVRLFSWIFGSPPARFLQRRLDLFARYLLPLAVSGAARKAPGIRAAYIAPFQERDRRLGPWMLTKSLRVSKDWLAELEGGLHRLQHRPVALVWGMRDPAFGRRTYLGNWRRHFPHARLHELGDAGHFLPEERPEELATQVLRALGRIEC